MRERFGFWRRPRMPGGKYRLSYLYVLIGALVLLAGPAPTRRNASGRWPRSTPWR